MRELKKDYKVTAVGHSLGDKAMLESADTSIVLNAKVPGIDAISIRSPGQLIGLLRIYDKVL